MSQVTWPHCPHLEQVCQPAPRVGPQAAQENREVGRLDEEQAVALRRTSGDSGYKYPPVFSVSSLVGVVEKSRHVTWHLLQHKMRKITFTVSISG